MDVTANLVTTAQLDGWMQTAVNRTLATVDEWCYAMNQILNGQCGGGNFSIGCDGCPAIDPPGYGVGTGADSVYIACGMLSDGSNRTSLPQVSSTVFLNALRNAQLAYNATNPAPGGSTTTPGTSVTPGSGGGGGSSLPPPTPASATGTGVLGLTNCSICQELASNPVMLLILAAALYFLFFR